MMKKLVLLTLVVCTTVFSFAQDQSAGEIVEKANAAVENKDYEKAIELFEKVLTIPDHGQNEENINKVLKQLKPILAKDKANAAIDSKEYDKAEELYKAAMKDYPDDVSIIEQAGVRFYNAGIKSYKDEEFLDAVKCFTTAEIDFKYEKAEKYKIAALKKIAENLASENGTSSVEEIDLSPENKKLLVKSLADVYLKDGYSLYQEGADIINSASEKVNNGSLKTTDEAYTGEVEKGKEKFKAAIPILEKAQKLDPSDGQINQVLDACKKSL